MRRSPALPAAVESPAGAESKMTAGTPTPSVPAGQLREESAGTVPPSRVSRAGMLLAGLVALVVVSLVAFSFGRLSTLIDPDPTTTSAEAGFARDMQVHHLQGVELAIIIRETSTDPTLRFLAYDIERTQAQQAGQLYGWLVLWDLPQLPSEPSMTWMTRAAASGGVDHSAHTPGEAMPGLATRAQVDRFESETGVTAERTFLTLMIAHHQGAIDMADAAIERTSNPAVLSFARGVAQSQVSEIELMERMLGDRAE